MTQKPSCKRAGLFQEGADFINFCGDSFSIDEQSIGCSFHLPFHLWGDVLQERKQGWCEHLPSLDFVGAAQLVLAREFRMGVEFDVLVDESVDDSLHSALCPQLKLRHRDSAL